MKKIKVLLDCLPDAPFKATLAAEVQAQHDYTRAVIAERDALQKQVQEQALQIISLIGQEFDK